MSKITLAPNASGTGTFTIASPNSNSNYQLDLPAESGTIITTASTTGISASALTTGTIPKARMFAGAVLQVVQATQSTEVSNSSSTWATTGLTASITPSSSSSKILARFSPSIYFGSANSIGAGLRIDRSGTVIYTTGLINNVSAIVMLANNNCIEYLDSPATTSSVTYTLQFNCPFANTPYVYPMISTNNYNGNGLSTNSTVILMEIAA